MSRDFRRFKNSTRAQYDQEKRFREIVRFREDIGEKRVST